MCRNNARQMRRSARSGNDDLDSAIRRFLGEIRRPVWGPVRRGHINLVRDSEIVESFSRLAHNLQIGITPHHNRNLWLAHQFSSIHVSFGLSSCAEVLPAKAKQTAVEGSLPYRAPSRLVIRPQGGICLSLRRRRLREGGRVTSSAPAPQYPSDNV